MINGKHMFHTHKRSEERKGKGKTAENLHVFAVWVLMKEYSEQNRAEWGNGEGFQGQSYALQTMKGQESNLGNVFLPISFGKIIKE